MCQVQISSFWSCSAKSGINQYHHLHISTFIFQTLLFYRPQTLEGEKRDLYVLLKFYKFLVDADITSFLVTFIIISSFSIILMFRSSGQWMTNFSMLHHQTTEAGLELWRESWKRNHWEKHWLASDKSSGMKDSPPLRSLMMLSCSTRMMNQNISSTNLGCLCFNCWKLWRHLHNN